MKKLEQVNLPKKYEYKEGITNTLYKQFDEWNKISYSQKTSFDDEKYTSGYIQDYILGKRKEESGIFADYGKFVGTYKESKDRGDYLSDEDITILDSVKEKKGSLYESEIVINLEPFGLEKTCLQGFSDLEWEENSLLFIDDFKTGNSDEAFNKYGDLKKYWQTRLYAYQRELEGNKIGGCRVIHFGRKGNQLDKTAFNKKGEPLYLRLTNKIDYIDTPYKKEDVEEYLRTSVVATCKEISQYFKVYNNVFK